MNLQHIKRGAWHFVICAVLGIVAVALFYGVYFFTLHETAESVIEFNRQVVHLFVPSWASHFSAPAVALWIEGLTIFIVLDILSVFSRQSRGPLYVARAISVLMVIFMIVAACWPQVLDKIDMAQWVIALAIGVVYSFAWYKEINQRDELDEVRCKGGFRAQFIVALVGVGLLGFFHESFSGVLVVCILFAAYIPIMDHDKWIHEWGKKKSMEFKSVPGDQDH